MTVVSKLYVSSFGRFESHWGSVRDVRLSERCGKCPGSVRAIKDA